MEYLKAKWKAIAESVGMTAVVMSLIFVGLQLRQSEVIAINQIDGQYLGNRIEANSQINEHANIWVRGLAAEELSVDDAAVFENLLLNINDITYFTALNHFNLGSYEGARITIVDFAIFLHRYPGARRVWEARERLLTETRAAAMPSEITNHVVDLPYVEWVMQALVSLDQSIE